MMSMAGFSHVIPPTADLRAKRQIDMASDEIDTRGGGGRPVTSTNPSTTSTSIPRRGGLGDVLAKTNGHFRNTRCHSATAFHQPGLRYQIWCPGTDISGFAMGTIRLRTRSGI